MEPTSPQINTTNPEAITYTGEELQLTVLGGIKLEGLDRMRVTLKIEVHNRKFVHHLNNPDIANLALRHNIDLYNDTQVEKLIRRTADRLEIGTSSISKSLNDLTTQLEQYRLKRIEEHSTKKEVIKSLTSEERGTAESYLSAGHLMERTGQDIGRSGVGGETNNRLLMFLIFTSRKTTKPLHIVSLGSSGNGKTYLQEKVAELIPEEDKLEITTLSENAFYYFGQRELQHKLILIEDLDGAENVLYPLRELQSKKRITKTVTHKDTKGITKTIHLTVEGPVSVAGCTTQESIYEDNANRSFLIYIDESPEQDERIMEYQRKLSAGTVDVDAENKVKELFKNCQRILQPITVRNPYAEALKIPNEVFKPRRSNAHYLAFIEAVTFYHQYQREYKVDPQSGEYYIETTLEDIEEANKLIKEVLLRKADELTGACRNYFERLKAFLLDQKQSTFTNREVRAQLRIPGTTVRRYHNELLNNGYIKLQEDKKAKGYRYEVVSYEEYKLLQQGIGTALDECLHKISQATEPAVSHVQNGSPKKKRVSKLEAVSHAHQQEQSKAQE